MHQDGAALRTQLGIIILSNTCFFHSQDYYKIIPFIYALNKPFVFSRWLTKVPIKPPVREVDFLCGTVQCQFNKCACQAKSIRGQGFLMEPINVRPITAVLNERSSQTNANVPRRAVFCCDRCHNHVIFLLNVLSKGHSFPACSPTITI